jgi:hypothetical protein
MRIVSLLPSATEIVCGLGLEEDLVAITHECDFPPSVATSACGPTLARRSPSVVTSGHVISRRAGS